MTENNPYSTPDAELAVQSSTEYELQEPRMVGIGRGASWLSEGFNFFKQSAGAWIGTCIVGFIIMIVLSVVPLVNLVTGLLTYVWLAGLMLGLRAQDDGKPFELSYLFAGFKNKFGKLMLLGLVMMVISVAIVAVLFGSLYWEMMSGGMDPNVFAGDVSGFMLKMAFAMLLFIPLAMAIWFAPVLIVLHDVSIASALRLSFVACTKNFLPFLVYGVVLFVLMIVGTLPLMLGMLVVMPVFFGSVYASYKDIFIKQE